MLMVIMKHPKKIVLIKQIAEIDWVMWVTKHFVDYKACFLLWSILFRVMFLFCFNFSLWVRVGSIVK